MKLILTLIAAAAMPSSAVPIITANSALNDYNLSFDAAERMKVFARSEADFVKAHIFVAERIGDEWNAPIPIGFSAEKYADSDPWLTPDGSTLYFISDRPAEGRDDDRTDYDIWRSVRTASGWSAPEHLGPEVNSSGQELGPELHKDVLYFSSARRAGAGGLDIYHAKLDGQTFKEATLLAGPFNTASSESDFTLSADGTMAMFWRSIGEAGIIHLSRRDGDSWSLPAPLPASINIGPFNFTPSFSSDNRHMRYASTMERPHQHKGLADLYEAQLPLHRLD
jgi:hypothetical protein